MCLMKDYNGNSPALNLGCSNKIKSGISLVVWWYSDQCVFAMKRPDVNISIMNCLLSPCVVVFFFPAPAPPVCSVAGYLGWLELLHHLFLPGSGTSLAGKRICHHRVTRGRLVCKSMCPVGQR